MCPSCRGRSRAAVQQPLPGTAHARRSGNTFCPLPRPGPRAAGTYGDAALCIAPWGRTPGQRGMARSALRLHRSQQRGGN